MVINIDGMKYFYEIVILNVSLKTSSLLNLTLLSPWLQPFTNTNLIFLLSIYMSNCIFFYIKVVVNILTKT